MEFSKVNQRTPLIFSVTSSSASPATESFDVIVVGGGPAGLTAALYTTRLGHDTLMIDRGGGRAAMMLDTHNVIGVPESVSGNEFLATAQEQVESYGTTVIRDFVTSLTHHDEEPSFTVETAETEYTARRVVLAMGFADDRPDPPLPRTGRGLHYCLHCDAYMFINEPVFVMGHSASAAHVAMILLNFTNEVDLLLRGESPTWNEETDEQLRNHPIDIVHEDIEQMERGDDGWLEAFIFTDGTRRDYKGGFPMYGADYHTELATDVGLSLNSDGTIPVDDHGRTDIDELFAIGDITPGHNQIPVAMGEGANAGIEIHMDIREYPRSLDAITETGPVTAEDVPGVSPELQQVAADHNQTTQ